MPWGRFESAAVAVAGPAGHPPIPVPWRAKFALRPDSRCMWQDLSCDDQQSPPVKVQTSVTAGCRGSTTFPVSVVLRRAAAHCCAVAAHLFPNAPARSANLHAAAFIIRLDGAFWRIRTITAALLHAPTPMFAAASAQIWSCDQAATEGLLQGAARVRRVK